MAKQLKAEEIFEKVSKHIAEALAISQRDVKMESKIFIELRAESLDVVDIRFRIEEEFGFKVPQEQFIQSLSEDVNIEHMTVAHLVEFIKTRIQ